MFKKKDYLLIGIVLLAAGGMALFLQQGGAGETVRIMIDGEEYGTYSLGKDCTVEVKNAFGYNRIVLEDGEVFMQEADCPDQYCVEHIPISQTNEMIVCLPHKLVVEVHGPVEADAIDSVVQ